MLNASPTLKLLIALSVRQNSKTHSALKLTPTISWVLHESDGFEYFHMWALVVLNLMFCKYPVILIYSLLLWQMLLWYISRKWTKVKNTNKAGSLTLPTPFHPNSLSAGIFRWLSSNIFLSIPSPLIRWQKCLFYLITAVKLSHYFFLIFLFSQGPFWFASLHDHMKFG